jgi:hypothetical protein
MGNYCNVDLEFPLKPELNRPKRNAAIVQAQIAICEGDRIWAENVRFISRLNLNPLSTWKRSFFHKCYFESTDDALAPTGVYLGCVFKFFSSKPFAQTRGAGAVILDSDIYIVGNRKTQYMVKRNSPLALVDVRFHADNDSVKIGWIQDSDFDAEHFYYQYNVRLNGKPVILNGNTVDMTDKSILEVYNIKNFAWDWNPPVLSIEKIENNIIETEKDSLTLKTNIKDITWSVGAKDAGFVKLIEKENIVEIIPTNHTDEPREVIIYAETGNGLKAAKKITVKPPTLPAPTFIGEPKIIRKGNELILDYELNLNGKKDQSYIEWSEYDKEWDRWIGTVPISISRNNIPQKTYHLTKGNAGRLIVAQITTKSNRSEKGEIRTVEQFISKKDKSNLSENINTNFRNFPEWNIPKVPFDPPRKGTWTIEEYRPEGEFTADGRGEKSFAPTSPWSYGFGFDGAAKAEGLYQTRRGARLVYTPVEDSYGDMSLTTTLAPCKSAGQGFGSATGQYLEIYIKYDTQTMTGYGLRIVRTPDNDRSVDFVLMEYKNGIATPISEAVTTSVYRTNCTVNLSVKDDILTATATTDAVYTDERPNIAKEVHLQAKISPDKFGGIGFQHTGTGNTNATVITHLKVDFGK